MFGRHDAHDQATGVAGITMKTLCFGERTLMSQFKLTAGSTLPRHSHPHEQTGYLVRGRVVLGVGEEEREMGPGDSWCIPGGVEHGADVLADSLALEVFSPVREDYLPSDPEAMGAAPRTS
jgi:quercetin dioxygenase-like cupin family protein